MKKFLFFVSFYIFLIPLNVSAQETIEIEVDIAEDGEVITLEENRIDFKVEYLAGLPVYSIATNKDNVALENWLVAEEDGIMEHSYTDLEPNTLYSIVFVTDITVENGVAALNEAANIAYSFDFKYVGNEDIHETDNAKYLFKENEIIDGTMLADKIVALEIEFTNKKNEPVNPWMQFAFDFVGEQETDTQVIDLLGANAEFASDYKTEFVKNSNINVKPGATVTIVVGYSLQNPNKPVYIRDRNILNNNGTLFEMEVEN